MTAVPICDDVIRRQILRQPWSTHLEARQIAEPLTYMLATRADVEVLAAAVKSALSRKAIAFRPYFFAAEETYFDWLWAGVQVRRVEAFRSILQSCILQSVGLWSACLRVNWSPNSMTTACRTSGNLESRAFQDNINQSTALRFQPSGRIARAYKY
ncbi:hypothetical protein LMH87_004826 [Akanthomyces muscarius]|uniref:Uncharacterized protein n=1 Tax=Akanthomyces muscarius TaxID=2231603 RepID=A0A9W8UI89_AKAMU|nr:hypothetical protein LMH87_004826 [Akanthomyces muscarius]KAJ4145995.1 hypothetical protein LMH87_004826 [Akanthomyces muscarius]